MSDQEYICPWFTKAENGRRWRFPSGTTIRSVAFPLSSGILAEKPIEKLLPKGLIYSSFPSSRARYRRHFRFQRIFGREEGKLRTLL